MRIVQVIPSLDPADGGPPQVALRIGEAQARLGHEVTLLHLEPPRDRATAVAGLVDLLPGSRMIHLETAPRPAGLSQRFSAWKGRIARLKPEIVHLHGVWEPEIVAGARECRSHGIPYVVETFGTLNPWSLAQKRIKKRLFLALLYRRMLRGASFLHALNLQEAGHLEALGFGTGVEVFPNGVFLEEFADADADDARRSIPALGSAPYVLFMARLTPMKGLDILADAFIEVAGRLPEPHLVVAGPRGASAEDFEQRIAAAGVADRVHVVGEVGGSRKYGLLRGAACFAQPSRNEGFSVSILEALASSLPVVITPECNFPEVAEHEAGAVVPIDSAAVASALTGFLTDRNRAAAIGANARRLVETQYTWEAIATRCVEAYRRGIVRSQERR